MVGKAAEPVPGAFRGDVAAWTSPAAGLRAAGWWRPVSVPCGMIGACPEFYERGYVLPVSVESLIAEVPALAVHARTATLLRPLQGTPGVRDSSVGGPLLWPVEEPWPVCRGPHVVQVREKLTDEERESWQRIDRDMKERARLNPGRGYEVTEEDALIQERIMAGASALDMVAWERLRWV